METGDYDRAKSLGVIQGQVYSRIAKDQINAGNYDDALSTIETGFSEAGADEVGREELTYNQAVAWEYKAITRKPWKFWMATTRNIQQKEQQPASWLFKNPSGQPL